MIERYGFIVKAENYDFQHDSTTLNTSGFATEVVGVSSDEDAILVARKMIKNGIQVIELCGGFGLESATYISECLDTDVPTGYVTFTDEESRKLEKVLLKSSGA
ncbi:DUF6506 family protein [Vibrio alginolyticus]|uniref:DUF6506 family protein n=1 Tax=Vibrio alginolyticus TaxID=663 RepID=UPI00168D8C2F|nr:DUF6506 family protein [Vibrio alginolyticus]